MNTSTWSRRVWRWLTGADARPPQRQPARRARLAAHSLEDSLAYPHPVGGGTRHDRLAGDRTDVQRQALEAWRNHPLARRIVGLVSQYVVGGGITLEARQPASQEFLIAWWRHRLNRMDVRISEWCDELTRSGNLIVLVSTDAAGMSYVRALPTLGIDEIIPAENDLEQARWVVEKPDGRLLEGRRWAIYAADQDSPDEYGQFPTVALHYAINRPVGALWGESDLSPLLRWLTRYTAWLEDRVRLNRFRQTFMYWVRSRFINAADRIQRQNELSGMPPEPGSILVTDADEEWQILKPNLESQEAAQDGLAIKKAIAAGSGNPLHFLAEPESSTRSTAEAAGGPTFRHYEQRQRFFLWLLGDLAQVVLRRRAQVDPLIDPETPLQARGSDISARDNAALATAAATLSSTLLALRAARLIDDHEVLRLLYRFAGEQTDLAEVLRRGQAAPPLPAAGGWLDQARRAARVRVKPVRVNPISGELPEVD